MNALQEYPRTDPMPEKDPEDPMTPSLCERLRAGSVSALADILRESHPIVAGALRRDFGTVLNAQDRDELVTEAAYRLWNARARLDCDRASVTPYLVRIARNLARDRLRRLPDAIQEHCEAATVTTKTQPTDESAQMHALRMVLDSLDEAERRIILTHACLGDGGVWTHDLVEEFDMPANALRAKRVRTTEKIRKRLRALGFVLEGEE
jgi:RNA polymerase sigma factor (sigma-70 family)